MAKKSAIDKNLKRQKKVSSNAARRARLKAIVMDRSLPIEERFRSQHETGTNAAQRRQNPSAQSLSGDGASARLLPQARHVPYCPA